MKDHPTPLPHVLNVPEYFPGSSGLDGIETPIKLSSNENCYGPSPKAQAAIAEAASEVHLYPVEPSKAFTAALGAHFGIDPVRILTSTGSDDLIPTLMRAYVGPGDEALFFTDSFPKYRTNVLGVGGTPVQVPRDKHKDYEIDPADIAAALSPKSRLFLLDNPCNPMGVALSADQLHALHANLPSDVVLAIDEAYVEFSDLGRVALDLVDQADNVVVFRTFSKAYGLAGLRVGWCYGPGHIINAMARIKPTFPLTGPSVAGAMAALEDRAFFDEGIAKIRATRGRVVGALRQHGWHIPEPAGNFFLLRFENAPMNVDDARKSLEALGIIVRPLTIQGEERILRITVGTDAQMDMVLSALTP